MSQSKFRVIIILAVFIGFNIYYFGFKVVRSKNGIKRYYTNYVNDNQNNLKKVTAFLDEVKARKSCFMIYNLIGFDSLDLYSIKYDSSRKSMDYVVSAWPVLFPDSIKYIFNKLDIEKVYYSKNKEITALSIMSPIRRENDVYLLYSQNKVQSFNKMTFRYDWIEPINQNWMIIQADGQLFKPSEICGK
jgi:hypothetical protein